jgi:hypothetical protein
MDPVGSDRDGILGQRARHAVAVAAVGNAAREHGVDVEPEAQREHEGTVAPASLLNTTTACYSAGEESAAGAAAGSR